MHLTSDKVKQRARELGFDVCGVAAAQAFPELAFFRQWIDRGYAGTMGYLPRSVERRSDVRKVVPSAQSVIVTGTLYNCGDRYSTERNDATLQAAAGLRIRHPAARGDQGDPQTRLDRRAQTGHAVELAGDFRIDPVVAEKSRHRLPVLRIIGARKQQQALPV